MLAAEAKRPSQFPGFEATEVRMRKFRLRIAATETTERDRLVDELLENCSPECTQDGAVHLVPAGVPAPLPPSPQLPRAGMVCSGRDRT